MKLTDRTLGGRWLLSIFSWGLGCAEAAGEDEKVCPTSAAWASNQNPEGHGQCVYVVG